MTARGCAMRSCPVLSEKASDSNVARAWVLLPASVFVSAKADVEMLLCKRRDFEGDNPSSATPIAEPNAEPT